MDTQTPYYNHDVYLSVTWENKQKEIKVVLRLDSGDGLYVGEEERFFYTSNDALNFMKDIRYIKTMIPHNAREQFNTRV